ncbi:MAG TPA: S8/S53 family peptidase [Chloroflexota bacterium]
MSDQAYGEAQLVNHLPDEVCVDVSAAPGTNPAALYEQVRAALNRHLHQDLPRLTSAHLHRDGLSEELARDVEPRGIRSLQDDVLQPLARDGARWVGLSPSSTEREQHWHCYYQVGPDRVSFAKAALAERTARAQQVRQLTNVLNLAGLGIIGAPTGDSWSLSGSQPNWVTSAMPFSCGSPAALPVAERGADGPGRFEFGDAVKRALAEKGGARHARVIVAILDTCPTDAKLDDHGNPRLAELLRSVRRHVSSTPLSLPANYFEPPREVPVYWNSLLPWWQEVMPDADQPPPEFAMPDHGLFVSGIVHEIAPNVEIHLVRVLNDFGVGDLLGLEHVLRALPDALLRDAGPDTRLIVNLSLGSAVPVPRQRFFGRWLPDSHQAQRGGWPDARSNQILDRAHGGLASTVRWLHDQGVLVVAAAGNDALREHLGTKLPPPRYPAYYEPVLAVAAADADGSPAAYSNRGDVAPLGNGVTTFGGSIDAPRSVDRPAVTRAGAAQGRQQSIVGLYSSPRLPGGGENQTGWVHWSGTSFAAPIVTALAAQLWQQDAAQKPLDLIRRVRECAHNIGDRRAQGRDPDGPLDAPYLEAWQSSRR